MACTGHVSGAPSCAASPRQHLQTLAQPGWERTILSFIQPTMPDRLDRELAVECTFDGSKKRIRFKSAQSVTYQLLRDKVETCFSLRANPFTIAYTDDDGEVSEITTDSDLTEAIQYYQAGNDDPPLSSNSSIVSGRSFSSKRITLRVNITVDFDGRLSDTSSLASLEDDEDRNLSQSSFQFSAESLEVDDDSVTVSSKDFSSGHATSPPASRVKSDANSAGRFSSTSWQIADVPSTKLSRIDTDFESIGRDLQDSDDFLLTAHLRYPEDPSAVFERLKLEEEANNGPTHSKDGVLSSIDRGAAWIRDQSNRAIISKLGALPEPSVYDNASSVARNDSGPQLDGGLALKRAPSGRYYYSYTSAVSSNASQPGNEDVQSLTGTFASVQDSEKPEKIRPPSLHQNWLASQQIPSNERDLGPSTSKPKPRHLSRSDPLPSRPNSQCEGDIPLELLHCLQNNQLTGPPPDALTDCSECGVLLRSIRYVCSTCGEKSPVAQRNADAKGKGSVHSCNITMTYHLHAHPHHPTSPRPRNFPHLDISSSASDPGGEMPPPTLPHLRSPFSSSPTLVAPRTMVNGSPVVSGGYELCDACIASAGVNHALEVSLAPASSPVCGTSPPSPEDEQRALSQRRRTAPKQKGQLRHGYVEKLWGHTGWEDVEQDHRSVCKCSTCNNTIARQGYKCVLCERFVLCLACYSLVHEIHPSHPFLVVPDRHMRSRSDPDPPPDAPLPEHEEQPLKHFGVKCAHCLLDIVGARFHCAICESVDICSNCESAGLPGNLDSFNGGHNSSHIMIKIPFPLGVNELQAVSRKAQRLWAVRDEQKVYPRSPSRPSSSYSSYARTVVSGHLLDCHAMLVAPVNHGICCSGCNKMIIGTRYQCANCPTSPTAYSLCESCEERSYKIHDPMHAFFKLPRLVKRPIEVTLPIMLYKDPVGPPSGFVDVADHKAYLRDVMHERALCDHCMTRIQGAWFRCTDCGRDLCDACEELGTHDESHVFLVFKSTVDMELFKYIFGDPENPNSSLLSHAVYRY